MSDTDWDVGHWDLGHGHDLRDGPATVAGDTVDCTPAPVAGTAVHLHGRKGGCPHRRSEVTGILRTGSLTDDIGGVPH
jgi:hypothetical protein